MNKNQLAVVKKHEFGKPLFHKIDSIGDNCHRDCHNKFIHTFEHICVYDIKLTNIGNNEIVNLTISGKSKTLYELNNKSRVAKQNGFLFNQLDKLTIKIYSHLRYINVSYNPNFQIPMCHRQCLGKISQSREYRNIFCNDVENHFRFAYKKWINQLN